MFYKIYIKKYFHVDEDVNSTSPNMTKEYDIKIANVVLDFTFRTINLRYYCQCLWQLMVFERSFGLLILIWMSKEDSSESSLNAFFNQTLL